MFKYVMEFTGRTKNAIGIFYPCKVEVLAKNDEQARLKLYDTHEHIHQLTFKKYVKIGEEWRQRITVKCYYENGNTTTTEINATFEEAEKYFVGQIFNLGSINDDMQKCIKIEEV